MVASSGRRLAHLVDDILDFSKLKNHQIELRRGSVSMREIVEIVLTLSEPLVGKRELVLTNGVPHDLPPVSGDENRLQCPMLHLTRPGSVCPCQRHGLGATVGRHTTFTLAGLGPHPHV